MKSQDSRLRDVGLEVEEDSESLKILPPAHDETTVCPCLDCEPSL